MRSSSRLVLSMLCLALAAATLAGAGAKPVQSAPASRPNIVLVLTDDQDLLLGSMDVMPYVDSHLTEQGMTFQRYFVPQALCCPARTSLLRGQYAHNHQVYTNLPPTGGFPVAYALGIENATLATALHQAGYRTALIGKYLNGYPASNDQTYIPPGWDEWFSPITNSAYGSYDYTVNDNGTLVSYAHRPQDYITDVLAHQAAHFITQTVALSPGQPFFLMLNVYAPHSPAWPAPRHWGMFSDAQAPRTPSFNEADMSDKPGFMQGYPPLNAAQINSMDTEYGRRLASLQAVDEAVDLLVRTLQATGQLDNTTIVFTSDNGYHLGQHRMQAGKGSPYEEDIHVPLIVRGPGVPPGTLRDELTSIVDLAPTFAAMAGTSMPVPSDGRSLLPLLYTQNPVPQWRQTLLVEYYRTSMQQETPDEGSWETPDEGSWEPPDPGELQAEQLQVEPPAYTALRTARYIYIERDSGDRELYDLLHDPYQLQNQWNYAGSAFRSELTAALAAYRGCAGASCASAEQASPSFQLRSHRRQHLPLLK